MNSKEVLGNLFGTKREREEAKELIKLSRKGRLRTIQELSDSELLERLKILESEDMEKINALEELAPDPFSRSFTEHDRVERYIQIIGLPD